MSGGRSESGNLPHLGQAIPPSPALHQPIPTHPHISQMHSLPMTPHPSRVNSHDFSYFDCGIYLFIGQIFPQNSVARYLPIVLKSLVMNPILTLAIMLLLYPLLSLIILPFYLLSYLVTSYGSWFIFIFCFISLIRYFAICMIFPGSLPSMERKMANDYLRGMANQFDKIGISASNIASSLVHASSGINSNITIQIDDLYTLSARSLPILIAVIKEGIQFLSNDQTERLNPSLTNLNSLGSSLESLQSDLVSLHSQLLPFATYSRAVSLRSFISQSSTNSADLVNFGMKCGATAHSVRLTSQGLKVSPKENTQTFLGQIRSGLSSVTDFWKGPQGLEKSALPMIRKHISLQYLSPITEAHSSEILLDHALIIDQLPNFHSRVCRFRVTGHDNNIIDGIFIGHSSLPLITLQSIYSRLNNQTSTPLSPLLLPTVLFCPPNAGLYEGLVMAQSNSSWLGYYLNRGSHFLGDHVYYYRNEFCCVQLSRLWCQLWQP